MVNSKQTQKKPGRPRSEEAHKALLVTTSQLMYEHPIRLITISMIAREAGVGKPTIYRWWDSKCSIIMDAFLADSQPQLTADLDLPPLEAIQQYLADLITFLNGHAGKIIAEIVGEGQSDAHIIEEFHARFLTPILAPALEILQAGQASGDFDPTLDLDQVVDLIFGPVFFRLIVGPRQLDDAFLAQLSASSLRILRPS